MTQNEDQEPNLTWEEQLVNWLKTKMLAEKDVFIAGGNYSSMRQTDLFRQFAGSRVSITDGDGNEIGTGILDEHGIVRGTIDGVEYVQQLTHLRVGEE